MRKSKKTLLVDGNGAGTLQIIYRHKYPLSRLQTKLIAELVVMVESDFTDALRLVLGGWVAGSTYERKVNCMIALKNHNKSCPIYHQFNLLGS